MGIIGETYDADLNSEFPAWLMPLPTEDDVSNCACWQKFTFTHAQLAAAAMTNEIEAFSLLPKNVLHAVAIEPVEACKGGGITAFKASVGLAGDTQRYAKLFDVFQDPGAQVGDKSDVEPSELLSWTTATSIRLHVESTTANLSAATQGIFNVYALISKLP